MTSHLLSAVYDSHTAAVTCPECMYSFVAPVAGHRIDLSQRAWYDRGDRATPHVLMPSLGNPGDGING